MLGQAYWQKASATHIHHKCTQNPINVIFWTVFAIKCECPPSRIRFMVVSGIQTVAVAILRTYLPSFILQLVYNTNLQTVPPSTPGPPRLSTLQVHPTHNDPRARFISTLDPSRLLHSDYHIISNNIYLALCPRELWPYEPPSQLGLESDTDFLHVKKFQSPDMEPYVSFVVYTNNRNGASVPFPKGTHGFFYYYRPTAAAPVSGHMRFRITSTSNPTSWASGTDLCVPNGLLWKKPLLEIIGNHPKLTALRTLLLADALILPELVKRCTRISEWRRTLGPNIIIYELGQAFWTAFSAFDRGQFVVIGREEQRYVKIESFFRDLRSRPVNPYSGKYFFFSHSPNLFSL